MRKIYRTYSVDETIELANDFADTIQKGCIITLEGDLGVGKTAFTKGIGKSLEIREPIISPTFTLLKEYEGRLKLVHIDAYRLEGHSADPLALYDMIDDDALVVIEWSNYILDTDFEVNFAIKIDYIDDTVREITIEGDFSDDVNS